MNQLIVLKSGLDICRTHSKRINHARSKLTSIFPAELETWRSLSEDSIESMDQLVFRSTKLQDALGLRVFTPLLLLLEEPVENVSMLDKLNRLEKLGALQSKTKWQELRNLRNNLAHEYADQDEENLERFNYFFKEVTSPIEIFQKLEIWITKNT